jgi:hypothetical protein
MTRGMRSLPAWPKPPGIVLNRQANEALATVPVRLGFGAEFDLPLEPIGRRIHAYGQNHRH